MKKNNIETKQYPLDVRQEVCYDSSKWLPLAGWLFSSQSIGDSFALGYLAEGLRLRVGLVGVDVYAKPTLEELIEVCGDRKTIRLQSFWNQNDIAWQPDKLEWQADTCGHFEPWDADTHKTGLGKTPTEAVANLWLALKEQI